MPKRAEPFINGFIYHVYNKAIEERKIFVDPSINHRFLDIIQYYRSSNTRLSYSRFIRIDDSLQKVLLKKLLIKKHFRVHILCFCMMPTHFHLLIKQAKIGGISQFIADITNSITRFYNLKCDRKGPLFFPRFQSVRITTDEQLWHVSRYIHLNPYSSKIVSGMDECESYLWSSLHLYLDYRKNDGLCSTSKLLHAFKDISSYRIFVRDQAEYQRSLEEIKHVNKW